jgi:hypothetical protein
MSQNFKLNLTLFGLLILLAAGGVFAVLSGPESFENGYEACEPSDADLTLNLSYHVSGTTGGGDCAFTYRKRDRLTRLWEWYQDVRGLPYSRTYHVNGDSGGLRSSHGGKCEDWSTWAAEIPEGVEVDINHTVTSGKEKVEASAKMVIPFLLDKTGHQGKISYVARWQEK